MVGGIVFFNWIILICDAETGECVFHIRMIRGFLKYNRDTVLLFPTIVYLLSAWHVVGDGAHRFDELLLLVYCIG